MWKIKDLALKDKINQLVVSDDRIATCCREQMKDPTDYISLESEVFKLSMRVDKDYFEEFPEYNPDGWNPYPEILPPEEGEYLITVKIGERSEVRIGRWGIVGCDDEWVGEIQTQIQGFKELPEPYKKGGLNGNHTDTLRADPI